MQNFISYKPDHISSFSLTVLRLNLHAHKKLHPALCPELAQSSPCLCPLLCRSMHLHLLFQSSMFAFTFKAMLCMIASSRAHTAPDCAWLPDFCHSVLVSLSNRNEAFLRQFICHITINDRISMRDSNNNNTTNSNQKISKPTMLPDSISTFNIKQTVSGNCHTSGSTRACVWCNVEQESPISLHSNHFYITFTMYDGNWSWKGISLNSPSDNEDKDAIHLTALLISCNKWYFVCNMLSVLQSQDVFCKQELLWWQCSWW